MLWTTDSVAEAETRRLVSHVSRIAADDALALSRAGWALASVCRDLEGGAALIGLGLSYNPNLAIAWTNRGMVSVLLGHHEAAIDQLNRARRLSPIGSATNRSDVMMALAYFYLGNNSEALSLAYRVLRKEPNLPSALTTAAMAHALAGDIDEARKVATRVLQLAPTLRITDFIRMGSLRRSEDVTRSIEALRLAGLPE